MLVHVYRPPLSAVGFAQAPALLYFVFNPTLMVVSWVESGEAQYVGVSWVKVFTVFNLCRSGRLKLATRRVKRGAC